MDELVIEAAAQAPHGTAVPLFIGGYGGSAPS